MGALLLGFRRQYPAVLFTSTLVACSNGSVRAFSVPSTTSVVPKYMSIASPNFLEFSERILGDWKWNDGKDDDDSMIQVESVQEVMRSCGGAVQGIREIPSFSYAPDDAEGGYYLNRANDGFLYHDEDGSYSFGPVKIGEQEELWMSSLSFGKTTRLLIQKNDNMDNSDSCQCLQVCRKSVEPIASANTDDSLLPKLPDDIVWEEIVRCRMPSPTQPWMTQRLKWEKCRLVQEGNTDIEENEDPIVINQSWALDVTADDALASLLGDVSKSVVWSSGGVCTSTGIVKSILRQYSTTDGSLQSVAWLKGRIGQKDSNEQ